MKLNPPVKKLKLSHFWFKAYDEIETEIANYDFHEMILIASNQFTDLRSFEIDLFCLEIYKLSVKGL